MISCDDSPQSSHTGPRANVVLTPLLSQPADAVSSGSRIGRCWSGDGPIKLSILMPAFNEVRTISQAIAAILNVELPCEAELIVIDDGSTDGTGSVLAAIAGTGIRVVSHPRNLGKGAALLSGAAVATGTHVLPFDADLEYSPDDIPRLLEPVLKGRCDIVYGTRLFGQNTVYQSYHYAMGNRALTGAANIMFNAYLSDLHTCLKLVPLNLFRQLNLRETGFGLDTEVTASLLRQGARPFEVPVSYHSRSHDEGKKINWRDGVHCLRILGRVRFAAKRLVCFSPLPVAGEELTQAAMHNARLSPQQSCDGVEPVSVPAI